MAKRRVIIALIGLAVGVVGFANVGNAIQIVLPDRAPHPAPGTGVKTHDSTFVGGTEWSVVSFRNSDGKLCLGTRIGGAQGIACTTEAALFHNGPVAVDTGWTSEGGVAASWIWGIAQPQVRTVSIAFTDCSTRSVNLDSDGFFLIIRPGPQDQPQAQRVTAYTSSGEAIGSNVVATGAAYASDCTP